MTLFLIDQSKPTMLRYRCDACNAEGISNQQRAPDGFLLDTSEDPPRWVHHDCDTPTPKKKKA